MRKSLCLLLSLVLLADISFSFPSQPPARAPLFLIQDIHANIEAQKDIAQKLTRLLEGKNTALKVGVEGAAGVFDFSPYRADRLSAITDRVGQEFLDTGRISGVEYQGLMEKNIHLIGVENPDLYRNNVEAYRRAAPNQEPLKQNVEAAFRRLEQKKDGVYPPSLCAFDKAAMAYEKGITPLSRFLKILDDTAPTPLFTVQTFLAAHDMETTLDFSKVEAERRRFLEDLLKKANDTELSWVSNFLQKSTDGSLHVLNSQWDFLLHVAQAKGLTLAKYPLITDYNRYLKLSQAIDPEKLFGDIRRGIDETYKSLCRSNNCIELANETRRLLLTHKLIRFELTSEEWNAYKTVRGVKSAVGSNTSDFERRMTHFEDFYRLAEQRNEAMVRQILEHNLNAIVVGGFHTQGLLDLLSRTPRSVTVLRPQITYVPETRAADPLSVFAQEKTPLQKLFSKWKLFLAHPAALGTVPLVETPQNKNLRKQFLKRKHALARTLGPRKTWLTETIKFLGPLALGLLLENKLVIGLGFVHGIIGLVQAHAAIDHALTGQKLKTRFLDRLVWSGFLTLSYLAAYGATKDPITSLVIPAALHFLDHYGFFNPQSTTAFMLFDILKLPRVLMSADGPTDDTRESALSPSEQALKEVVKERVATSIDEWRKSADYPTQMAKIKQRLPAPTKKRKSRPVIGSANDYLGDEASLSIDSILGDVDPIRYFSVNLKQADFTVDPVTDALEDIFSSTPLHDDRQVAIVVMAVQEGFRAANFTPEELTLRTFFDSCCAVRSFRIRTAEETARNIIMSRAIYITLYGQPDLTPYGQIAAYTTSRWIAGELSFEMAEIFTNDDKVDRFYDVLKELLSESRPEFLNETVHVGLSNALLNMPPEDVRHRVQVDLIDNPLSYDYTLDDQKSLLIRDIYQETIARGRKVGKTDSVEIIIAGLDTIFKRNVIKDVRESIEKWRASGTTDRSLLDEFYVKTLHQELDPKDMRTRDMYTAALGDGYREAHLTHDELQRLAEGDVALMCMLWANSRFSNRKSLDILLQHYADLKPDLDAADGIKAGWTNGIRSFVASSIQDWLGPRKQADETHDIIFINVYHHLAQLIKDLKLDRVDVIAAVADGYFEAQFTPEQWRLCVRDDFDTEGLSPEPLKLVNAVYAAIAEDDRLSPDAAQAVKEEYAAIFDFRKDYEMALSQWKTDPDQDPVAPVLIRLNLFSRALLDAEGIARANRDVAGVLTAAQLTPEQIRSRIKKDVEKLFPPDPHSDGTTLTLFIDLYLEWAKALKAQELQAEKNVLLDSLLLLFARIISATPRNEISSNITMRDIIAQTVDKLFDQEEYDHAYNMTNLLTRTITPGYNGPKGAELFLELQSEAAYRRGDLYVALFSGGEIAASLMQRKINEDIRHKDRWVEFFQYLSRTGFLLIASFLPHLALEYMAYADFLLLKHPKLREAMPQDLIKRHQGIKALAQLMTAPDTNEIPNLIKQVEDSVDLTIADPMIPEFYQSYMRQFSIEANLAGCRTGDPVYLAKVEEGVRTILHDNPEGQVAYLFRAYRSMGLATGDDHYKRLSQELFDRHQIETRPMNTMTEIYVKICYATHLGWTGHSKKAVKQLDGILKKLDGPDFSDDTNLKQIERFKQLTLIVAIGLLSADKEPQSKTTLVGLIKNLCQPNSLDERSVEDWGEFFPKDVADAAVILEAAGTILMDKHMRPQAQVALVRALRKLDLPGLEAHTQRWQTKGTKAVKEELAQNGVQPTEPAWPGNRLFPLLYEASLRDVQFKFDLAVEEAKRQKLQNKANEALQLWSKTTDATRINVYVVSGVMALMGLGAYAVKLLELYRNRENDFAKIILRKLYQAPLENKGIVYYPTIAGDPALAVKQAEPLLTSSNIPEEVDDLSTLLLYAANVMTTASWNSSKELVAVCDKLRALIQKITNPSFAASVLAITARLLQYAGRTVEATKLHRQLLAMDIAPNSLARSNWTIALPHTASNILIDPTRSLSDRFGSVRNLAQHQSAEMNKLQTIVSLHAAETQEDYTRIAKNILTTYEEAKKSRFELPFFKAYATAIVETALALPAGAAERTALEDIMAVFDDWIISDEDHFINLIRTFYKAMAANRPQEFLDGTKNSEGAAALKLIAAHQTGQTEEALNHAGKIGMIFQTKWTENYLVVFVAEYVMLVPMLREAYLAIAKKALSNFDKEFWREREPDLRRLMGVSACLGDPEILYLYDRLAEGKFMLKNDLVGPTGLIQQMEQGLTPEEWLERVKRTPPEHVNAMADRARSALQGEYHANLRSQIDGAVDHILRPEKEAEEIEKQKAAARGQSNHLFNEAKSAYENLDLNLATERLVVIDPDYRPSGFQELSANVSALYQAWGLYQEGKLDEALERAAAVKAKEPVAAQILIQRITRAKEAKVYLREKRPQQARDVLDALNGCPMRDMQAEALQKRVDNILEQAEKVLEEIKQEAHLLQQNPDRGTNTLHEKTKKAFSIDIESKAVLLHLIDHAERFITRKNYPLAQAILHILYFESALKDEASPAAMQLGNEKLKINDLRSLARVNEMIDWVTLQYDLYRTGMDALRHKERRIESKTSRGGLSILNQPLYPKSSWHVDQHGQLIVDKLWIQNPKGRDGNELMLLNHHLLTHLDAGMSFVMTFQRENERPVRIPLNFMEKDDTTKAIKFQLDHNALKEIKKVMDTQTYVISIEYVSDLPLLYQVIGFERALSYLHRFQSAVLANRAVPPLPGLDRLFGLNIRPQPVAPPEFKSRLSDRIQEDKSQTQAVLSVIHPHAEVVAVQGPPGTGKSFTGAEAVKQVIQSDGGNRGRIVIGTAQAHAGVDSWAEKLQAQGITIIRSASESAKSKVANKFRSIHNDRLRILWNAIKTHHTTGLGFVYLATNNGLIGDRVCFKLLQMYLNGDPIEEIELAYLFHTDKPAYRKRKDELDESRHAGGSGRPVIRPVWGQEEAGQANLADLMAVYFLIYPDKIFLFGDHDQLSPSTDDELLQTIAEELEHGFVPSANIKTLMSETSLEAIETSLFELMYDYSETWEKKTNGQVGGGVITVFLNIARRSIWIITLIVNIFYDGRLKHRQHHLPPQQWDPVQDDTVIVVNTNGKEQNAGNEGRVPGLKQKSKRNFKEVGEIVRATTYFLNKKDEETGEFFQPKDLLLLTPYKAQNQLINDTLHWLAICNDFALSKDISNENLEWMKMIIEDHAKQLDRGTQDKITRHLRLFTEGARQPELLRNELLRLMRPLYNLDFKADIQISMAMIPALNTNENGIYHGDNSASLDEFHSNYLEAKTVHRVQGSERKCVLYSNVRSEKLGFLDGRKGRRILNVAFSRAQEHIVIIHSNSMRPAVFSKILGMLETEYRRINKRFIIRGEFPTTMNLTASLRQAWNIPFINSDWEQWFDRHVAWALETPAFFAVLSYGILQDNPAAILLGLILKGFVFPALHRIASQNYSLPAEIYFAMQLIGLYLSGYLLFYFGFGISQETAIYLAHLLPGFHHFRRNVSIEETAPMPHNLELDTLGGVTAPFNIYRVPKPQPLIDNHKKRSRFSRAA